MKNLIEQWFGQRSRAERIYIVPTLFGCLFGLATFAIITYGALAYAPVVVITGLILFLLALLAMVETHVNVRDIRVNLVDCPPVPAGGPGKIVVELTSREGAWGVEVTAMQVRSFWKFLRLSPGQFQNVTEASHTLAVPVSSAERGYYPCPAVTVSSYFPFGMFRSWKTVPIEGFRAVYPKPAEENTSGRMSLPNSPNESTARLPKLKLSGDNEFKHHREWQPGDPVTRLDSRASQRRGVRLIRVFEATESTNHSIFSWRNTIGPSAEERLAQLARWVCDAQASNASYRLELPSKVIGFGKGEAQWRKSVTALASFQQGKTDSP